MMHNKDKVGHATFDPNVKGHAKYLSELDGTDTMTRLERQQQVLHTNQTHAAGADSKVDSNRFTYSDSMDMGNLYGDDGGNIAGTADMAYNQDEYSQGYGMSQDYSNGSTHNPMGHTEYGEYGENPMMAGAGISGDMHMVGNPMMGMSNPLHEQALEGEGDEDLGYEGAHGAEGEWTGGQYQQYEYTQEEWDAYYAEHGYDSYEGYEGQDSTHNPINDS